MAAATLIVLAALDPASVLTNVLPWKTDLTGHVVVPWVEQSQPYSWLPGSWSDTMFLGFPINQLYPWLPGLLAAALGYLLPLAVAFKLVVVAPVVLLPWALWRAARWSGLPAPIPPLLAVAVLPFLFDTTCLSCGGNIASALTGEYAFAWSLFFAVLALGAVDRLAQTGSGMVLSALLVTATALSHPLPTLWLVIGVFVVAVAREVWAEDFIRRPFALAAACAALMAAMWWVPFLVRRDWMPLMGFQRRDDVLAWLLPGPRWWAVTLVVLALLGAIWAARRREWLLVAVVVQTVIAGAAFVRIGDGGQLYNLRVLPFWQFGIWILAFVGAQRVVLSVVQRVRADRQKSTDPTWVAAAALGVSAALIGSTWGWWGVTTAPTEFADGRASILGIDVTVTSQSTTARAVLGGPSSEEDQLLSSALANLVAGVASVKGCGRIAWDEAGAESQGLAVEVFQQPWQSPLWTDGCITPISGVLTDSSATAGAAIMTQDLVSTEGLRVMPSVPDLNYNLAAGVTRMRTMGVRYYLTHGGQPEQDAGAAADLALVASAGPWKVWEIAGSSIVMPLANLPAVVEPRVDDRSWDELSNAFFLSDAFDGTPLAQDGPTSWPRVGLSVIPPEAPVDAAIVSDVRVGTRSVTFTVDRVGAPVLVRVSDFPGWTVTGAEGPFRATPNFVVVVPTDTTVTLTKGRTAIDWVGALAGFAGLALLVGLALHRRLGDRDLGDLDEEGDTDSAGGDVQGDDLDEDSVEVPEHTR